MPDLSTCVVFVIGESVEFSRSFLQIPSDFGLSSPQWDMRSPKYVRDFYWISGTWKCSERYMIWWARHLEYLQQHFADVTFTDLMKRNNQTLKLGAICLTNPDSIESTKHCIDSIQHIEGKFPYIVALKEPYQLKSWHSKINILNDPNTLTYNPDDKTSIKRVWQTMILRFKLEAELEQRFLDCIEWKV